MLPSYSMKHTVQRSDSERLHFYYHTTKNVLCDTDIYWLKYKLIFLFLNTLDRVIKFKAVWWVERVTSARKRRGPYICLVGNLRERDNLEDFSVYGKLILRWMCSNLLCIRSLQFVSIHFKKY